MCKIFFCVSEGKAVERWISPVAACALFREPQPDFADYTCVLQHWLTHSIISPTVTWEIKRQKLDPYWLTFFGKKIWDCVASNSEIMSGRCQYGCVGCSCHWYWPKVCTQCQISYFVIVLFILGIWLTEYFRFQTKIITVVYTVLFWSTWLWEFFCSRTTITPCFVLYLNQYL